MFGRLPIKCSHRLNCVFSRLLALIGLLHVSPIWGKHSGTWWKVSVLTWVLMVSCSARYHSLITPSFSDWISSSVPWRVFSCSQERDKIINTNDHLCKAEASLIFILWELSCLNHRKEYEGEPLCLKLHLYTSLSHKKTQMQIQTNNLSLSSVPTSMTCFLLDLSLDAHSTEPPLRSTVNSGLDWPPPNWTETGEESKEGRSAHGGPVCIVSA